MEYECKNHEMIGTISCIERKCMTTYDGDDLKQLCVDNENLVTQEKHRMSVIWNIISGGGVLEMRVDKAIRKIEKWYPTIADEEQV